MNGLERAEEIGGERAAQRLHFSRGELAENLIERGNGLMPRGPLRLAAQQVFLRHHFEDRADILRHATVHEDQGFLQSFARRRRDAVRPEQGMAGQQAAAAEPVLDVVRLRGDSSMSLMPGQRPPESCQPPPEPPSHSPRIARAATMRRSDSSIGPVSVRIWPVARMQAR